MAAAVDAAPKEAAVSVFPLTGSPEEAAAAVVVVVVVVVVE